MQSQDLPFHFSPFPFPRTLFFSHVFSLLPKTPTVLLFGVKCGNKSLCCAIPGMLGNTLEASLVSWDLHWSAASQKDCLKVVMATQKTAVPQPSMAGIRPLLHPFSHQPPEPPQTLRLSFSWKVLFVFWSNQTLFLRLWVLIKILRRVLAETKETAWRMALESPSVTYMLYFGALSQHLALLLCFSQPNEESGRTGVPEDLVTNVTKE